MTEEEIVAIILAAINKHAASANGWIVSINDRLFELEQRIRVLEVIATQRLPDEPLHEAEPN